MSNKSYRIRTDSNTGDSLIKVKLDQHYDHFNILSLNLKPSDTWSNRCSDFGVVIGRVTANKGFGVPNAKVSIFFPLAPEDESRPEIVEKYPFKEISDKRNDVRYNLLPSIKQHPSHTPVGTFPTKEEILRNDTWIEIYQKYYRFTTRTNDAGDFMFYGVPTGSYMIHYDVDLSDIGELSVLPFEMIAQGTPSERFKSPYQFKGSTDIDTLPQIVTKNKMISVQPFWGSKDLCDVQINRSDFDLTENNVELKSYSLFMGSVMTDSKKHSVNKNCGIRREMGSQDQLIPTPGGIEILHVVDSDGDNVPDSVEFLDTPEAKIDENGVWAFLLELNGQKVVTDEFGNETVSTSSGVGIVKNGFFRFKFSLGNNTAGRIRETAKYIVPNNGENENAYLFNRRDVTYTDQYSVVHTIPGFNTIKDPNHTIDGNGYYHSGPLFREFTRKKIYSIRNYISRYTKNEGTTTPEKTERFIGLKLIDQDGSKTPIPYNRVNPSVSINFFLGCIYYGLLFPLVAFLNKTVLWFINEILKLISDILNGIYSIICGIIKMVNGILRPSIGKCAGECELCIDLGDVLGKLRLDLWCFTAIDTPKFCEEKVELGIAYLSFECCGNCDGVSDCNCYVPWYNCYKGDPCEKSNTSSLKRCKDGSDYTAKCEKNCKAHQEAYKNTKEESENEKVQTKIDCRDNLNACSGMGTLMASGTEHVYNFCYDSLKQCKLGEQVCQNDDAIKLEFSNAWLIGSLYFFLIKYKETGSNHLGSIKFCDVDESNSSSTLPFKNKKTLAVIGDREFWLNKTTGDGHTEINVDGHGVIKYFPRQPQPTLGSGSYEKLPFDDIYYAARTINKSNGYNMPATPGSGEGEMLFATDTVILGSYLVMDDPDNAPFFFNLLPPTTYKRPDNITNFFCFTCDQIQPSNQPNGSYLLEKICEFGSEFNDEGEASTAGNYSLYVDDTYFVGRNYIIDFNTARDTNDTPYTLQYGSSWGNMNYVLFGTDPDGENVYLNQSESTPYVPKFFDTTDNDANDRKIRFEGNPYYMYFGLLPGKTAIDVVGDKFIPKNFCNI